ncbi:MAG: hypothetical protein JJU02_03770 [Cryomorphaceae bacterium]|nr:hypothetical protein [Cryomorphaceae bacterium]
MDVEFAQQLSKIESTLKRIISIKIDAEGIFEPEQVRIQKSTDKEDFGRKGFFRVDSKFRCWLSKAFTVEAN